MIISLDTETTGVDWKHGSRPFFVTTCDEEGQVRYWEWDVNPLTREVVVPEADKQEIQAILDGIEHRVEWLSSDVLAICTGMLKTKDFSAVPILADALQDAGYTNKKVLAECRGRTSEERREHLVTILQKGPQEPNEVVGQNVKFDVAALNSIGITGWPWSKTHDTLRAGHLLASNRPHNLTDMAVHYLGVDIEPLEIRLKEACEEARRYARQYLPEWQLAKQGREDMPSAKEKCWKLDTWLPRTLCQHVPEVAAARPEWLTVLAEYANADSGVTIALWKAQLQEIHRRGLWEIYSEIVKGHRVAHLMEGHGLTLNRRRLEEQMVEYTEQAEQAGAICTNIAASLGYELDLPKGGNNNSLRHFCFGKEEYGGDGEVVSRQQWLNLPPMKRSEKTGEPSFDKSVIEAYESELPAGSKQLLFVRNLAAKRKRDTAISYMQGYMRFWVPTKHADWYRLYPNLNPTGTDTLRWSSNNPNEQNISKQEGFNLRHSFGPEPDREWWSFDAKNLELRIPTYEAGETELISVFSKPDEAPYFGSYHLVVFDTLHPELFRKHGKACKDLFESTWYQWVKNGNFAIIYGAQQAKADATYHVRGAYEKIAKRFPKIADLAEYQKRYAEKHGYVQTIPDKEVCPDRGYPLLCARTAFGGILPTTPLNYHVSGTAMWWMARAMIKVQAFFDRLNRGEKFAGKAWPGGYYIALQVHDELVPDMPSGAGKSEKPWLYNLPIAREVQRLMVSCGEGISVPTPVSMEYHADNWSVGIAV